MAKTVVQKNLKARLLGGSSMAAVLAVGIVVGSGSAMAAGDDTDAVGAVANPVTVTATDADGLLTTDYNAASQINIDSNTGAITLGAVATNDAITFIEQTGAPTMTVAITTTGTNNLVTFAGDIEVVSAADVMAINATNTDVTFQGDVATGGGVITYTAGAGSTTQTTTFDTSTAANNAIAMVINASAAGDNITLAVTDTNGGGNTITFANNIGGGSAATAIDTITLATTTVTVFTGTVRADTITNSATGTTTFNNNVVGNLNMAADGTAAFAATRTLTGNIDNTTGTDGAGTVTFAATGGAVTLVSGTIGATNSLKAVTVDTNGGVATFTGAVKATTFTATNNGGLTLTGGFTGTTLNLDGTGTHTFSEDVTAAVVVSANGTISVAADKKVVGSIDNDSGGATGTITFLTSTANTTLVSGNVGATNAFTALNATAGAGTTQTFGGTVAAQTITLAGTGTTAFSDDVTAATEFITSGDGTITMAANKKFVGSIDTDAGASEGTFTFAATTTDTTLVSGSVGDTLAVKAVNVAPASGVTATFTGAYDALTTTHSGAGTVAFGSTVGAGEASNINISGGGAVTIAGATGGGAASNVDNTSGADGSGTLTIAAGQNFTGNIGATNSLASVTYSGATTQTGTVNATTINVAGAATVAFTNNDITGILNYSAAGTATVTADEKIVGSVTTSADGQGTLTFATTASATTLVSGNVGTSSNALLAVTAGSATGITAKFGGDVYADTLNISNTASDGVVAIAGDVRADTLFKFTADGTLEANGTGAQTFTGAITTGTDDTGNITVSNTGGTVTFASQVSTGAAKLGLITLNASTTTVFSGTVFAEQLTTTGTSTFEGAVTVSGAALTINDNAKIIVGSGFAAGSTVITAVGAATVDPATAGGATIEMPANFTSGTITLIDGDTGAGIATAQFSITNTALADYTLAIANGGQDLTVTAVAKSTASTAAAIGVSSEVATSLSSANTAVATGDASALSALTTAMNAGGATAKQAAEEMATQADTLGAGAAVSVGAGAQAFGVASNRLASVRSGGQYASAAGIGFNTGDEALTNAAWIKPFGNVSDQDESGGVAGYAADTLGVAVGIDTQIDEAYRVGASFAYSGTDVDGDGAGNSQLDIQSYQVTLYGDYTAKDYYIEGMVGYAMNATDTSRSITFGGLNRTALGEYDSNQYMVSVGGGMPMSIGNGTFFTPTAGLAYTHVTSDSYTETGAGNLNQTVAPEDLDAIIASIGGKLATTYKSGTNVFIPELRAGLSYDLSGDEAVATATYTGGGAAFTTTGAENEELAGNVGLGLTVDAGQGVTFAANYDADVKSGFLGHSASLEARFKF